MSLEVLSENNRSRLRRSLALPRYVHVNPWLVLYGWSGEVGPLWRSYRTKEQQMQAVRDLRARYGGQTEIANTFMAISLEEVMRV